jgi:hypothetical protein
MNIARHLGAPIRSVPLLLAALGCADAPVEAETVTVMYTIIYASDLCRELVTVERPAELWEEWFAEECFAFNSGPGLYADADGNCIVFPNLELEGDAGLYCWVDDPGLGFVDCALSAVEGCCESAAVGRDCG